MQMAIAKLNSFPGLTKIAPETIEAHTTEQQLRDAQFELDVQMHDLRSEFLQREGKLRRAYLDRVNQIAAGEAE
jgi:hypothetical protein